MRYVHALFVFALAVGVLVLGCKDPVTPKPDADATPIVDDAAGDNCLHACAKLGKWGCPEANDKCIEVCEHSEASGKGAFALKCILDATEKANLKACNVRCGEK